PVRLASSRCRGVPGPGRQSGRPVAAHPSRRIGPWSLLEAAAQLFGEAGASAQLFFKVGQFPASVFQEELSADRIQGGEHIDEKSRGVERDHPTVLFKHKAAKRNEKLAFPHEKECQSHQDHGRQKEGICNHGGSYWKAWSSRK